MKHSITISKVTAVLIAMISLMFSDLSAQYHIRTYDLRCNNNSGHDNARSIIHNLEGGNTIAGFSYAAGCGIGIYDWMFMQVQPSGNHLFARLYGTHGDDRCNSVIQTRKDSTSYLAGFMQEGQNFLRKATFLNVNRLGGIINGRMINDTVTSIYNQNCIDSSYRTANAGWKDFYPTATSKKLEKIIVTNYSPSGVWNWGYLYNTMSGILNANSFDEAQTMCYQKADDTYGVASRTNIQSKKLNVWDIMVTKLANTGGVIWNKTYAFNITSSQPYPSTEPRKIIPMSDGGFVVAGFTNRYVAGENDIIVFRVDASGNLLWSYCYGNTAYNDIGQSIVLDGNNLVLTGSMNRTGQPTDAFTMKIPVTGGAAVWTRLWNRNNNTNESGYDIIRSNNTTAPGYSVTGDAAFNVQDAFLWRSNSNGFIPGGLCNDSFYVQNIQNQHIVKDIVMKLRKITDKSFTPVFANPAVVNILRCFESDSSEPENTGDSNLNPEVSEVTEYKLNQNYPNPFNPVTKISYDIPVSSEVNIKVFNSAGKEVMTLVNGTVNAGRYEAVFNGSTLSSGIYYYRITVRGGGTEFTDVKKMILVK
ncbi:MAG TPA: T9SS type A sorting domain-containing protein [Ignavibacteria bacterium]|nr:hypothetical protein [Bacteroidota bacterium]HRI86078.1 T9SS type A sorting domain-containing protein [Ignavibacteria bacterium]HRK00735.1 T9SS type A sorting domain-containing protein [Ignavibacteria bacterium]